MNKELIKKYLKEFDHWLNGGKLLYCSNSSTIWYAVIGDNVWSINSSDLKIVIDDEYVELRKALAEGKTIQYYVDWFTGWQDVNSIGNHCIVGKNNYRIKPDEHKFKEGDWVRDGDTIYQFIEPSSDWSYKQSLKTCILWKPQPNEWCWSTIFGLIKIICETTDEERPCYLCWNPWKEIEHKVSTIEPFIGELPTHLKD